MISWRRALRTLPWLAVLLAAGSVFAAPSPGKAPRRESTHRMIVKLRDQAESKAQVLSSKRVSKLSASSRENLAFFRAMSGRAHVMKLPRRMSLEEARAVAKRLMADPDVEYAEPDIRRFPALAPDDPRYGDSQWHYYAPAAEKAGANLPAAWDVTTGAASVVVAVIDTGILAHADFDPARLVQGYDFISPDDPGKFYTANDGGGRDSDPSDPGDWITAGEDAGTEAEGYLQGCGANDSSWHGTHVAGTVGARTNNAAYAAGVDWTAKILPVRVLGKCGGYDSDIADGIRWAAGGAVNGVPANANPAKVINMSIQGSGICPASYQSAIDEAIAAGAVVVASAGNAGGAAGSSPPGNCDGVITVAAVNRAGNLPAYSNYGPEVEISAPGGEGADGVYSLSNTGLTIPVADAGVEKNGTSMAAPHVSGIAALMRAFNSNLTPAAILADLQACSRPFVGGSTCDTSNCGAGMVDARGALRPGVASGLAVTAVTANQITWTWTAVPNAPSYNVYVASSPGVMLGNTAAASFTRSDLTPNVYTGIIVKATNTVCAGGPSVAPSTATIAMASAVTVATPWVSSMTVTFSVVASSNNGYRVDASTASDFTGTLFSTRTANPASSQLTVLGLATLTSYYLRVAVLNQLGNETRTTYGSQVYTLTSLTSPGPGSFSDYGTRQLRLSWTAGGNPSAQVYTAQASTASDFTGTVSSAAGTDLFQNLFMGLQVNTSYFFRVWPAGGPSWSTGPVATWALSPSTATPLFSAVADQALTVSWTAGGNPAGTLYEAQVSRGADFFSQVVVSSFTRNPSATFGSLTSNSVYYARVRAISHGGQPAPAAYRTLSSTGTLASPVSPIAPFFQAVSNVSLAALFDSGANAAGTGYVAQLSTASDFSVIHAQVSGVMSAGANEAPFSGLESNRRYYLQTAALNVTGTPTAFSQAALPADRSTSTFPAPPAYSSSTVYFTSITFVWSGGNRTGTTYDILVDDDPDFGSPDASATTSLSSSAVSLSSNTAYYARVRARALEPGNPDTSYVDLSPSYTLPEPPTEDPAGAFLSVTFTSATVRWQARPVSPPAASSETCSGYRIQLSPAQGFTGTVLSADVAGAASTSGSVAGLTHSTTYYLRIGSLNADGAAAYTLMGSTRTLVPRISSSPVTGSTELSVALPYPEVRFIRVSIAEKTFAVGTPVELNASVAAELPPLAGQAELSFIGAGAGFSLSAGGLQPVKPVPITIGYALPVGVDDRLLMLARFDDASHKWLTLPSSVDRGAKTLTGLVDHFSFFAPLIVQPGTDVSAVEIYPIPWEPESGSALFGGTVLTFARLPALARVRVYTTMGDLLDEATAGASGVLHWDGRNTRGHRVGTGTYLAVIESNGAKSVRSIAVIR